MFWRSLLFKCGKWAQGSATEEKEKERFQTTDWGKVQLCISFPRQFQTLEGAVPITTSSEEESVSLQCFSVSLLLNEMGYQKLVPKQQLSIYRRKNLVLLESPVKPFCQAKGCPGSWCWKPSTAGSPLFLMCPGRSLAWGGQSFGFFTVWTFFTLGSTALQEPMGSSLCYSSTQSIKCTMSRPNSSADPPPSKEVHPSMFTTEASCKMRDSLSLPTDCLKEARGLAFASLSFSKKIYVETRISVEHLWIKMCNFNPNVLTVEDLPLFNTANCVL